MVDPMTPAQLAAASAAAMWEEDRAAQGLGIAIEEIGPGRATVTMAVREDMVNGHGLCHGGFIFTLADAAFAYACNSYGERAVASGADITFVKSATLGDQLRAVGRETARFGRSGIYDIVVTDAAGEAVAHFRGRSRTIGGSLVEGP